MRQSREQSREESNPRAERIPVGVPRLKLNADSRAGYVRRWVNDNGVRLEDFRKGGYEFVTDPTRVGDAGASDITSRDGIDSRVSRVVGQRDDGGPLRAYLMEIRQDWYDEDQLAKQKNIDEQEAQMERGEDGQGGAPGRDGRYVPREGISINSVLT